MSTAPSAALWMGAAFAINCLVTAIIFATFGAGLHGAQIALMATARVSFLWFWTAYAGGALEPLFGVAFKPLKQYGREFGLAFAAALLVHLCLVAWFCYVGGAPKLGVFIFFGTAALCAYIMALFSLKFLHQMLSQDLWWLLRTVTMNFILFAFFVDFIKIPFDDGIWRIVKYLPFTTLTLAAPMLRLAAWVICRRGATEKSA